MNNAEQIQPKDMTEDQRFNLKMELVINTDHNGLHVEILDNDLIVYCDYKFQAEDVKKYRNHKNSFISEEYGIIRYFEIND